MAVTVCGGCCERLQGKVLWSIRRGGVIDGEKVLSSLLKTDDLKPLKYLQSTHLNI